MIKEVVVQEGQVWTDSYRREFMVLHRYTDPHGHEWVHYRQNDCPTCREHCCWLESFLERFTLYS